MLGKHYIQYNAQILVDIKINGFQTDANTLISTRQINLHSLSSTQKAPPAVV